MNPANIQLDKQKKILIVIFFVLIAYMDNSYILKAQRTGLSSLDLKIARLNTDLVNLNRGLENMRSSKTKPGAPGQKKAISSSMILRESQISELLQEISTAANKFDIKIAQIRPSRQALKEKSAIGQDKLTSILINLELICDYHNLGRFIQALENLPVFMGVQELEISTQLPDYMKQKVTLVLKTYVTK
ncbi:MAG: type 4a pilus biogenesis protein PilO [Candidatus Omnitrophota bacterium]|nr:type 4a pilus biogenesis protein PilO [Candidatus Omnitrophota bacterium]